MRYPFTLELTYLGNHVADVDAVADIVVLPAGHWYIGQIWLMTSEPSKLADGPRNIIVESLLHPLDTMEAMFFWVRCKKHLDSNEVHINAAVQECLKDSATYRRHRELGYGHLQRELV